MQYIKKAVQTGWNALVRGITGCAVIYVLAYVLKTMELPELVGVNAVTFLTVAVLGVPGFFLLYGLALLFLLL